MFFKKKDKTIKKPDSDKKNPFFKSASGGSKDTAQSELNKKPLVDTSFVFFEDK